MPSSSREIKEGLQEQGAEEEIVYTLTTTPWGSTPTAISVTAFSVNENVSPPSYSDVTSTLFPTNSPSANGDVITLSLCKAMTADTLYRIEIKFTCSGNKFEPYAMIRCRR